MYIYVYIGITSCWGDKPDPKQHTTFNARTYLQTQLNKAAKKDELLTKGDKNPKDFILFNPTKFTSQDTTKDNTGTGPNGQCVPTSHSFIYVYIFMFI